MKLSDHLSPEAVLVPLPAGDKIEAITRLVDLAAARGGVTDRDRLLEAVLARERLRTTAVGRGLAIPHAKTDACDRLVMTLGRTAEPLEFQAIDGRPVRLVVMIASPMAQASVQIQMLARLSRLVINDGSYQKLLAAGTATELVEVVRQSETT